MAEQGLVVVKDNFFVRVTRSLKRFFFKGKLKKMIEDEQISNVPAVKIDFINQDTDFVQEEILNARRAFRKYVINNNKNISEDIFSYILEKIQENETKIKKIIEINNDSIAYEDIISLVENEKRCVNNFKLRNKKTGCYQVPLGVIGAVCKDSKDAITNILKSISTRNSIIILHENYSKYSTESLVLLIVQECLKNFYIDDNIIQMFEKEEIDLTKLDRIIGTDDKEKCENKFDTIYIYQEDDYFENDIINEIERLKNIDKYKNYEIKVIKGEFGNIINYLNKNKAFAICMYTNNSQKAYKFINWIDSPNVFVNTGINGCKDSIISEDEYSNFKYVLHENVF